MSSSNTTSLSSSNSVNDTPIRRNRYSLTSRKTPLRFASHSRPPTRTTFFSANATPRRTPSTPIDTERMTNRGKTHDEDGFAADANDTKLDDMFHDFMSEQNQLQNSTHVKKTKTNTAMDKYEDTENQNQLNSNDTPPPRRSREDNESQEILRDMMIQQLAQHEEEARLMFKGIQHHLHTRSATKDKYRASPSQSPTMSLLSAPSQSNLERTESSDTATPSIDSLKPVNPPSLCTTTTTQMKLDATNAQSLAKSLDVLCTSYDKGNAEWNDALGDAIQILSSCTRSTDDDSMEPVTVSLPHLTAVMGVKASLNVAQYLPQGLNRWKKQAKEVKSGEHIKKCIILLKTFMTHMELD